MHLYHGIKIALEALWAHKLKTFLTLLGNIVGVMFVMAIVSIMDGAKASIENAMSGEGSGLFQVSQMNALEVLSNFDKYLQSLHNPKITEGDLAFLRERVTLAEYMDAGLSVSAEIRNRSLYIKSVSVRGRIWKSVLRHLATPATPRALAGTGPRPAIWPCRRLQHSSPGRKRRGRATVRRR